MMWAALWVFLLTIPLWLEPFWEQTLLFAMASIIGAIGLTVLVGTTGQLSLAHAFFAAVGAYGYCYFAGHKSPGVESVEGLGLPPVIALVLAVLLAGICGALFSPISGRVRGIYLGIASIGLVFIGQHILFNATDLTGGFNGRDGEPFSVAGFHFTDGDPDLTVLGVGFGALEKLWYLGLALVALSYWYARNIVRGRPGRALEAVRDSEVAASVMGVDVTRYKAAAFTLSSMYAGLAGVLMALVFGRIVPDTFGFALSVDFLVMIVIGGLGSIPGAALGAIFVSMLPRVLDHYSDSLPLVAQAGTEGLQPSQAARFLYGVAIIAVLLYARGGLASLGRRLRPQRDDQAPTPEGTSATPTPTPTPAPSRELKETST
ncbi:MAG: branched-chain amino acid transport system permease protein [Thermoleophilaceae bacterium]|jgi:branched-chain amino acid transport system permease protein|nr:branched-chain amino acid transport system permease protein [Thermoleophilaceae bacterium]